MACNFPIFFRVYFLPCIPWFIYMPSLPLLLVSLGYFIAASFKNLNSFFKLAELPDDVTTFRNDLCNMQSQLNAKFAKYFLLVALPLLASLTYSASNFYLEGLTVGVHVTSVMVVSFFSRLETISCLNVALFSSLAYYIFSFCWSKALFDLNSSVFYNLIFCLIVMPFVMLSLIFFSTFLNQAFQLFLVFFFNHV